MFSGSHFRLPMKCSHLCMHSLSKNSKKLLYNLSHIEDYSEDKIVSISFSSTRFPSSVNFLIQTFTLCTAGERFDYVCVTSICLDFIH